ncbi:hypothetical protein QTN25_007130 [Entamoeba marina]
MKRKLFQSNKTHLRDGCIETFEVIDILNKLSKVELCLKNLYIMNNEQLNLIVDTKLVTSDKNDLQRIVNVIVPLKSQIENQTSNQFSIGNDDNSSSNSPPTQLFNTTKDNNEWINRNAKSLREQICNLVDYFKNNSDLCEYYHLECLSHKHHFTTTIIQKQVLLKAETTPNKPNPHKRQLILDHPERDILAEEIKNTLRKQNNLNYSQLQQFIKSSFNKDVTKEWLYDFVSQKKLRHTNSNSTKY